MVDGQKQYTDLILNNPEGMTFNTSKLVYTGNMVSVTDPAAEAYTYNKNQIEAGEIWASNRDNAWSIPANLTLTQEEIEEYSGLYSDIDTYAAENIVMFVMGEKPMGEWDAFIAQVEEMGSARITEIYQTAMDRYSQR